MKMPEKEEEYELMPLSPLRKLEKRVSQLESSSGVDVKEFFHELVDIVKMNQQLVDELVKANDALRVELSRLPGRIEEMTKNLSELISFIKAAATEEIAPVGTESLKPLTEKIDKMVEFNKKLVESNEAVTSLLESIERKLRPVMPVRKPMLPPKPMLVK